MVVIAAGSLLLTKFRDFEKLPSWRILNACFGRVFCGAI